MLLSSAVLLYSAWVLSWERARLQNRNKSDLEHHEPCGKLLSKELWMIKWSEACFTYLVTCRVWNYRREGDFLFTEQKFFILIGKSSEATAFLWASLVGIPTLPFFGNDKICTIFFKSSRNGYGNKTWGSELVIGWLGAGGVDALKKKNEKEKCIWEWAVYAGMRRDK